MSSLADFADITKPDEPLAPLTWLKVGGPAQHFIEPRDEDELQRLVVCCHENNVPLRLIGGGSNVLVQDEGVSGVVARLSGDAFSRIAVDRTTVRAGSGALVSSAISHAVKAKLAGLEVLAGIPGTVGGALRGNAGGRSGDIGQFVTSVRVITATGEEFTRTGDALSFEYRKSSINELVILEGSFELQPDDPDAIVRRMRKIWIMKKATQPYSDQSAGCIFKNPRGMSAGALIEQAGLKGTRTGGAEVSDRHANFIVTHPDASAGDVLRLMDLIRTKVAGQFGVDLEPEIQIW